MNLDPKKLDDPSGDTIIFDYRIQGIDCNNSVISSASKGKDAMDEERMYTNSGSMNHDDVHVEFKNGNKMVICLSTT